MTISIIIPTYNRALYLRRTLDSVFLQTRLPDEVIVVDDGSTDDTARVIAEYTRPLQAIRQENGGSSRARNTGMRTATGEALLFLDSDDLLRPSALAILEAALEGNPDSSLAYCRAQLIDAADSLIEPLWRVGNEAEKDRLWEALVSVNFIRSTGCVLVRRAALEKAGLWDDGQRVEDWEMWLRLAEPSAAHFVRVPEPLLQYRIHDGNQTLQEIAVYNGARAMYQKHIERHPIGDPRRRYLEGMLAESPPLVQGERPGPGKPTLRHRILRAILEWGGIAPLYRRIPVGMRMRFRAAFGISPWTRL